MNLWLAGCFLNQKVDGTAQSPSQNPPPTNNTPPVDPNFIPSLKPELTVSSVNFSFNTKYNSPSFASAVDGEFIYQTNIFDSGTYQYFKISNDSKTLEPFLEPTKFKMEKIQYSPNNQKIAFVSQMAGDLTPKLYIMNIDGSNIQNVSGDLVTGGNIIEFLFTSNSQRIIYIADQETDELRELYSVDLNTMNKVKLNHVNSGLIYDFNSYAKITADNSKIVYRGKDGTSYDELFSVNVDGTNRVKLNTPLLGAGGIINSNYSISHDSSKVAYCTKEKNVGYEELYVVNIDGTGHTKLSPNPGTGTRCSYPKFIADDSGVVFGGEWTLNGYHDAYYANVDGTGLVKLNTALSTSPAWAQDACVFQVSPDSSKLLYFSDQVVSSEWDMYSINKDGSGRQMLKRKIGWSSHTSCIGWQSGMGVKIEALSDNQTLVYLADPDQNNANSIYSIKLDGTGDTTLVDVGSDAIWDFYISHDESEIIYFYGPTGNLRQKVGKANIDGSNPQLIFSTEGVIENYKVDFTNQTLFLELSLNGSNSSGSLLLIDLTNNEKITLPSGIGISSGNYNMAPDGSNRLIYVGDDDGVGRMNLYIKDLDTGISTNLTPTLTGSQQVFNFQSTNDNNKILINVGIGYDIAPFTVNLDGNNLIDIIDSSTITFRYRTYTFLDNFSKFIYGNENGGFRAELMIVNADGTGKIQLNPTPLLDDIENWWLTPDNSKIVYYAEQDVNNAQDLYVVNVDGTNPLKLSPALVAGRGIWNAEISADSQKVIYWGDVDTDEVREIYAVNIDGTNTIKLNTPFVANGSSSWHKLSSDRRYAIYSADAETDDILELYRVNFDGTNHVKLSGSMIPDGDIRGGSYSLPDWFGVSTTSDGSKVFFLADRESDEVIEMYMVNEDGSQLKKVSPPLIAGEDVGGFLISSDDQYVLIHTKFENYSGGRLYSYNIANNKLTRLHKDLKSDEYISDFKMANNWVAFRWYKDGHNQLFKTAIDGSGLIRLHEDLTGLQHVSNNYKFSFDNNWILFDMNIQDLAKPSVYKVPLN